MGPDAPPATPLPDDPAVLQGLVHELLTTVHGQRRQIDQLEHRLDQLLKRLYGPRADKLNPDQLQLFGEGPPPDPAPPAPPPEPTDESSPGKKTSGHGRRALPTNLRRVRIEVDVPAAEKLAVGGTWVKIGEEVSERLDFTPSTLFVRQTVRPKYVVRFGGDRPDQMRVADLPPEALPKVMAAPGLVADVIVSKCVDHLPLYRQEKRYARQGVDLSRSTLCGWLADAAAALDPLYRLLKDRVLAAKVVHTDDTPIPVQDPTRDHCRTGRIWAYVSTGGVVYEATEDRCRDGPLAFLADFRGHLQCDAYAGYDELFRAAKGAVVEVGCWAHARRKFVEAEKTSPREAHEAVARIRQLYAVEDETRAVDAPARAALRRAKATPVLDALKTWLDREQARALPRTPLADAITYATNQWAALTVYVTDGDLAIDNNIAERAIKPFAIGRKNWLFFGSDRGGRTLATLCSLTATCELRGVNSWDYLKDVLTRLPTTQTDKLADLLPADTEYLGRRKFAGPSRHRSSVVS
jgi:transposase